VDDHFYNEAKDAIDRVVGFYSRRYFSTDPSDLTQEAWAAVVDAEPRYDPDLCDVRGYCYSVAKYALQPFVLASVSQLSAPRRERGELFALQHVAAHEESAQRLCGQDSDTGGELDRRRWGREVAQRLAAVFNAIDGGDIAESCIVEERKASEVAAAFGVPVATVYDVTRKARRAVANDCELFRLWRRDDRNEN